MLSEDVRAKISQDPFASFLGIELLELGEGYSKVTLAVGEHMLNFHGILHGGVVFSLADAAFGAAANSHGQVAVALNVSISFLAPVPLGSRLYAEASEEKLGRRTALYRLAVTTQGGELVALCHGTVYRKDQPLC
ncbi:MAG: hydroxyphenylacetyl-CoA thioesterase PaaI [Thermoflexales bacterium]|nr:hydroxyphenylacetyl-CoA thioesterase PaaI [Thermoflexales bacterium]